jgi:hypothetical protein
MHASKLDTASLASVTTDASEPWQMVDRDAVGKDEAGRWLTIPEPPIHQRASPAVVLHLRS